MQSYIIGISLILLIAIILIIYYFIPINKENFNNNITITDINSTIQYINKLISELDHTKTQITKIDPL